MKKETNRITVADYIANSLPNYGVTHVYELVGGMITVLLDSIHQNSEITVISMHHEQAAGFAAEGHARASGQPSVAMATSGPGATNLLTAIGSCYFDSIPAVFITGQVNTTELNIDGRGRQLGFQETDIVSMAKPITKTATMVRNADEIVDVLDMAFKTASQGRPGPVLIDIPMDIQRASISDSNNDSKDFSFKHDVSQVEDVTSFTVMLLEALSNSEKPLIIAGGGVSNSLMGKALSKFSIELGIPIARSLMGIDVKPAENLDAGFLGSYGNRWTNWAISESDLLLVLGSRLDVRQTGSDLEGFIGTRRIFHVDIDFSELNNRVHGAEVLHASVSAFLQHASKHIHSKSFDFSKWQSKILSARNKWPDDLENVPARGINPNLLMKQISSTWNSDITDYVTDVGQHQMWAAQSLEMQSGQRFHTSGGMGAMGFGLPAAIGVSFARTSGFVCLIAGDGGFQLNIQELETLRRNNMNIRIVVINNQSHGMVRQFQESYFEQRYNSTVVGYSAPSFKSIGDAYGIPSFEIRDEDECISVLKSISQITSGPSLVEIYVPQELNAYPKMAFGQPFGSMEPDVKPLDMEGT